jgi:hypothetical protein
MMMPTTPHFHMDPITIYNGIRLYARFTCSTEQLFWASPESFHHDYDEIEY